MTAGWPCTCAEWVSCVWLSPGGCSVTVTCMCDSGCFHVTAAQGSLSPQVAACSAVGERVLAFPRRGSSRVKVPGAHSCPSFVGRVRILGGCRVHPRLTRVDFAKQCPQSCLSSCPQPCVGVLTMQVHSEPQCRQAARFHSCPWVGRGTPWWLQSPCLSPQENRIWGKVKTAARASSRIRCVFLRTWDIYGRFAGVPPLQG